ncbi:MAG: BsuBI/PstI family type II restriction endonuclease [Termitinemataceae bacterium]|nr:MAG: BsuBI/PstI family type II restriction endonuclease [Termitinemataceae bacterium]
MSDKINDALRILIDMGVPRAQQNERTALCLLALLDMKQSGKWEDAATPLVGITPMMEFARNNYQKDYAPNTRETFRRQSMHQLVEAGIALYNPDKPDRPVNSPNAVYQISAAAFFLAKHFGNDAYSTLLETFKTEIGSLAARYKQEREMTLLPVVLATGQNINLSPGDHSQLIKEIIESFAARFLPNATLLYVGETGNKWGYFDKETFEKIGLKADEHGKMPDVIFYFSDKEWLVLVESVTSHGPIDSKRQIELQKLFPVSQITHPLEVVYISAFPNKQIFARFTSEIAWETEVWLADNPTHMIHFNGDKFLG